MYECVLLSRKGRTDGAFKSLYEAGRLDTVHQCILSALFRSHGHRHDVIFHVFLTGPPKPPLHLEVNGDTLHDARLDERSWEGILRNVLSDGEHPGVSVKRESLQSFISSRAEDGMQIFVLQEKGEKVTELDFDDSAVFVLGDHIGMPKKDEKYVLRYGKKLSLGKQRYLAASCIDIINYVLDEQILRKYNSKR